MWVSESVSLSMCMHRAEWTCWGWGRGSSGFLSPNLYCAPLSLVRLFATSWTVAFQAPLSMEFPRQEYWSGLLFPPPGDLPDPGIKPYLLQLLHFRWILYCWATREASPLVHVFVFIPVTYYFDCYSFVISFDIRKCETSSFVLFSNGSLKSYVNFRKDFSISTKITRSFW